MARNRMIKPEFWEDDKIAECSPIARLLFVALWNFADDEGYIEYRQKWLKTKCLPYDNVKIEHLISEIEKTGRIIIQNEIIHIVHFLDHQKIDKPRKSNLKQEFNNSTNPRRRFDEDSTTKREYEYETEYETESETESEREEKKRNVDELSTTPSQTMKDFLQMVFQKNDRYDEFIKKIADRQKLALEIVQVEISKFVNHWTEKTPNGKRQLWQKRETFEVSKRLGKWFENYYNFQPQGQKGTRIIS